MKYHNITKDDMLNGDGLRVVLWLSGCNHGCKNCQNPITWDPEEGLEVDDNCIMEIEEQLQKDYIQGLTLSGGDPLHPDNRDDVYGLCIYIKCRYPNKTIWLYTGYLYEEVKDLDILKYIDVLVDGPYIEELKDNTYPWVGSINQRVIHLKNGSPEYTI